MYNLYNKVCKKIDSIIYTCVHVKKPTIEKNKNRQMLWKRRTFGCAVSLKVIEKIEEKNISAI